MLETKIKADINAYAINIHRSCVAKGASPRDFFSLNE